MLCPQSIVILHKETPYNHVQNGIKLAFNIVYLTVVLEIRRNYVMT